MKYVLGIDQGGTKTHAALADETGSILNVGYGPGACHSTHGMETAMQAVKTAVAEAFADTGLTCADLSAVAAGMTGVDWPDEPELLRRALAENLSVCPGRIHVVNDCIIALRAATDNERSCILCAGTGLNCAARDGRNRDYTFGFYIPDADQGGMALTRRTLQAMYDAESGMGPDTELTSSVLAALACENVDDLLRRDVTHTLPGDTHQKLPILLDEAAVRRDSVANAILGKFGRDIAAYAVTALRKLGLEKDEVDVVLSGSVFKCSAPVLLENVKSVILTAAPRARIIESVWEPIIGAVLLALDDLRTGDPETIHEHIKRDAQRLNMVRKKTSKEEEP